MRIALMMRAMEQESGFKSYVGNFVEDLLTLDRKNEYILVYRNADYFGRFGNYPNVEEILAPARSKLVWDQVVFPKIAFRKRADFIFNLKFSVPLLAHCPVGMGLQEPAWWKFPDYYERGDRLYMRTMLPVYIARCARLFPTSQFVVDETRQVMRLPPDEDMTIIYPRPSPQFRPVSDPAALAAVRERFGLPERFILAVTRVEHAGVEGAKIFFPGKNIHTAVRAFGQIRDRVPHEFVIAGRSVDRFLAEQGFTADDLARVRLLGGVPHDVLPALHSLSELFVIPSQYEGLSNALLEALACGDAIVSSSIGACREAAGDAALYADPYQPAELAARMLEALQDEGLRAAMKRRSLERVKLFSGTADAQRFLDAVERIVRARKRPGRAGVPGRIGAE